MTIKEYISQKLEAFNIPTSMLADVEIETGLQMGDVYDASNQQSVNVALCHVIEELLFAPKMSNISENGFSMSWNYEDLGKFYVWLCRKWRVKPKDDTLAMLGINAIIDRTRMW